MSTAQTIILPLTLSSVPGVMRRGKHALIFLRNPAGNFILGSKDIYPSEIYRMVGGGIETDEDPQIGAARELAEELQIQVPPSALQPLATVKADISFETEHLQFSTSIFFYQLKPNEVIQADDDLDGVVELSVTKLQALISRYAQLSSQIDEVEHFAWKDYGALYGPIHQIALDSFLAL